MCLFYLYATAKSEIQICSNKHETGLVYFLIIALCKFGHRKLDISKSVTARSFKLGQLIEDLVKIKKIYIFLVIARCKF